MDDLLQSENEIQDFTQVLNNTYDEHQLIDDKIEKWQEKQDEHEKSLNALIIGFSGALIAFIAGYIIDLTGALDRFVNISGIIAITSSSISIGIGILRSCLRSNLYKSKISNLNSKHNKIAINFINDNYDQYKKQFYSEVEKIEKEVPIEKLEEILKKFYKKYHPSNLSLKKFDLQIQSLSDKIEKSEQIGKFKLVSFLWIWQLISFLIGVFAIAGIVFYKLL